MRIPSIHKDGRIWLAAGIAIHAVFVASLILQFLNPLFIEAEHAYGQAGDYFGIYQAGDALVHGRSIYSPHDYKQETDRRVPYYYFFRYLPPTAYFAALASIALPPWPAYVVWVILNEILIFLLATWILRLRAYPVRDRRIFAALWLGYFPFYLEQWMGQFSLLMAAFLWIMLREGLPDRSGGAGFERPPRGAPFWAWAGSVGLKSYPALFALPYAMRRWWRPIFLCAGAVVAASAPYFALHPPDVGQFLTMNFRPLTPRVFGGALGLSAFMRLLGWSLPQSFTAHRFALGNLDVYGANVPIVIVNALLVGTSAWATWRYGRKGGMNLQLALWTFTFFLIFSDVWEYHYVMLLPAVTAIGLSSRSRWVLWMGVLLALPTPYVLFARPDHSLPAWAGLLNHACKPLPTIALYLWTLRALARSTLGTATGARMPAAAMPSAGLPASSSGR